MTVSALGLGTAALGGMYQPATDEEALATVDHALTAGVSYIDTAPHYTLGLAEQRVGRALQDKPRGGFVLSTKVGRLLEPLPPGEQGDAEDPSWSPPYRRVWDLSRDGIRRSLADSLRRLGLDSIDILYIHDPEGHEDEVYKSGFPALAELRDQGVIRAIGAGMTQAAMLTRFVQRLDIDVVLCAGRYTLLDQDALTALLPACQERDVSVVIGGVYNSGILANPDPGAPFDYQPANRTLVNRARRIADICEHHKVPLKAAAIQFPAAHPAIVSVLSGSRSPAELDENVTMFEHPIPQQLWQDLKREGLLPEKAPTS